MFKILQQPYPFFNKSLSRVLLQCLGEGAFIALFLILFQPYGSQEWHDPNKNLFFIGYGFITALSGFLLRIVLFKLFPNYYKEEFWTVGREILSILLLITIITTLSYIYSSFIFKNQPSINGFLNMFLVVMTVGIFPTVFGVMLNYIYQLKKYKQAIVVHHSRVPEQLSFTETKTIKLLAENEKDFIEIQADELLFISSSDNYSTIFYEKEGKLQKELLRSSLTRLEGQLQSASIVRCHRSYIVNLAKVEKVTGNAQGYKLHIDNKSTLLVPVARKYSSVVESLK